MVCNRCHRFLIAWSVRLGRRCAMTYQRCPNSPTLAAMIASSRALQPVRSVCLTLRCCGCSSWLDGRDCESPLTTEAGSVGEPAAEAAPTSSPGSAPGDEGEASGGVAATTSLGVVAEETAGAGEVGETAPPGLASSLAAAPPASAAAATFAACIAKASWCSCNRFHRLRTASSERPGINSAMRRHLSPFSFAWRRISRSSSRDHSFLVIPGVPLGASVACRFARQMCPFFGAPHRLHLYTLYLLYPGLLSSAPPPPTPPLPPPLPPPSPPISRSMATSHSHCSALIPWVAPPRSQPILSQTSTR
mmetsp:Transcript_21819/g.71223  ORF Transcript_21819/g.71223 Transcript_21819/m.71223 type:complete len:305 (-) Transcript_21819:83-997(-)